MNISILTLFPEMFNGPFDHSIIKRAKEKGLIEITLINIRDFGVGRHKVVDDTPYGGGIGMVMRVDVLYNAIQQAKKIHTGKSHVILLTASGQPFTQKKAKEFTSYTHLIILCGHYEGIDERVRAFIDEELSIGDFVTTGGELPAMIITDTVTRLIPTVLKEGVTDNESFSLSHTTPSGKKSYYLEYPQFTYPQVFEKLSVPDVLLSGNHKKIAAWRESASLKKTLEVRPDLLSKD